MTTPLFRVAERLCDETQAAIAASGLDTVVFLTFLYDPSTGEKRLCGNLPAEELMRFTGLLTAHILEQFEGIKAAADTARNKGNS